MTRSLKIAVIGQSVFAKDVYNLIRKNGHTVVGVFTIPDKNGREVIIVNDDVDILDSIHHLSGSCSCGRWSGWCSSVQVQRMEKEG